MVLKKGICLSLILAVLCTGSVSCRPLANLLVKPFGEPSSTSKKSTSQRELAKACYPVKDEEIVYIVRAGDTLGEIAQCFRTRWYYISSQNKLRDPDVIKPGQKLIIPARIAKGSGGTAKKAPPSPHAHRLAQKAGLFGLGQSKAKSSENSPPEVRGKREY